MPPAEFSKKAGKSASFSENSTIFYTIFFSNSLLAACFYIRIQQTRDHVCGKYYYAIYVAQHTAKNLIHAILKKFLFNPEYIMRVFYIHVNGLVVVINNNVVHELPEGQDMIIDISKLYNNLGETDSYKEVLDYSASFSIMKLIL